jgi:zona occludens toxin
MAIIFHEGLPRSGKSYEAMSRHIANALKAGRFVDAYIEGINHEKIALALEMPVEVVQGLLHTFTREQVPTIYRHVRNNALVVIDEAQNFWPTGRQRLDPQITQFITEHGHRGLDILIMGQVLSDVHKLWRGRVRTKVVFNKLDAVNLEKRYNAQTWLATAPEKFKLVGNETGIYDEKWFGTYASHVDDSIQTSNFKDDRANIFKNWKFRYGLPVAGILGVASAGYLIYLFSGGLNPTPKVVAAAPAPAFVDRSSLRPAAPAPAPAPAPAVPANVVEAWNKSYRPRLGMWHTTRAGESIGIIEWYQSGEVRERLSFEQIRHLGVAVEVSKGIAKVGSVVVTSWPLPMFVPHGAGAQSAAPAAALPFGLGGDH